MLCLMVRSPLRHGAAQGSACRPASRRRAGYTPTVFSELPRLERAGRDQAAARSPASLPCWSRATITMSRSRRGARHSRRPYRARPADRRARAVPGGQRCVRSRAPCRPAIRRSSRRWWWRPAARSPSMTTWRELDPPRRHTSRAPTPKPIAPSACKPALEAFMAQGRTEAPTLARRLLNSGTILKPGQPEGQRR